MADIRDHDLNVTVVVQVGRGRRDSAQETLRRNDPDDCVLETAVAGTIYSGRRSFLAAWFLARCRALRAERLFGMTLRNREIVS